MILWFPLLSSLSFLGLSSLLLLHSSSSSFSFISLLLHHLLLLLFSYSNSPPSSTHSCPLPPPFLFTSSSLGCTWSRVKFLNIRCLPPLGSSPGPPPRSRVPGQRDPHEPQRTHPPPCPHRRTCRRERPYGD